jgi:hypothetical protein
MHSEADEMESAGGDALIQGVRDLLSSSKRRNLTDGDADTLTGGPVTEDDEWIQMEAEAEAVVIAIESEPDTSLAPLEGPEALEAPAAEMSTVGDTDTEGPRALPPQRRSGRNGPKVWR